MEKVIDGVKSTLSLYPVNCNDSGTYKCRAFNNPKFFTEEMTDLIVECKTNNAYTVLALP